MLVEAQYLQMEDLLAHAKECVQVGPVPDWVIPCPFDDQFKGKHGEKVTHLLFDRQAHAERHEVYMHAALRLETMEAVQNESQWRMQFDPRTESVTVHSIKIRRDGSEIEHAKADKFQLLQREQSLEAFVVHGLFTLLLLLEDVRIGDVLETSITLRWRSAILPENCLQFFALPEGTPIGRHHVSARFSESRPMRWKSSAADLAPVESRENGEVLWVWSGENHTSPAPEPNAPLWHMGYFWIQLSDCPDWGTVARAVARVWRDEDDDPALRGIVREIMETEPDLMSRAERAIRLIQDEYRYLSVNLDFGGQIPSPPSIVARRRFGDCKDLSFLLVHLLRRLGVTARPILVNVFTRKSVADLLPAVGVFNHVIVEFQANGETRWLDATARRQGGGAMNRTILDFGVGLPVDASATELAASPRHATDPGLYDLKESILLDTAGKPSLLGVVLRTRGAHAEALRRQFEAEGEEKFAADRLQHCASRFKRARRISAPEYRDDHDANEFCVAEVIEIDGFLVSHRKPGVCQFTLPDNIVAASLAMPEEKTRRSPFALPHPCRFVHTIEIQTPGLKPMMMSPRRVHDALLDFDREMTSVDGYWAMTLTLATHADAVMPDQIKEHRKTVEEIRSASLCSLLVPVGHPHPRRRSSFGRLASLARGGSAASTASTASTASMRAGASHLETDPVEVGKKAPGEAAPPGWFPPLDTAAFADPAERPAAAAKVETAPSPGESVSPEPRRRKKRRNQKRNHDESDWQTPAAIIGIIIGVITGILIFIFSFN